MSVVLPFEAWVELDTDLDICTECGHREEQCTCDIEQSVTTPLETVRDNVQMALDAVANGDFTNARRWLSTVVDLVDGADTALIDQLHK